MKKQLIIATVCITGLLIFAQTASAGSLKKRYHRQEYRIQKGIQNGQITPREGRKLYRDQRKIRQLRRHYLSDGQLSKRERRILQKRMDRSSKRIYRYKHNHRQIERPRYSYSPFSIFFWR
jgi:hypothetical protein